MSNKNELNAKLQGIKSALDELKIERDKGRIDIRRYLHLKEEYETRKVKLEEEFAAISPARLRFGYITGLELRNIRAFKHLKIDLNDEQGPRMLSAIIGRNSTCKSTLLRCIALGLGHMQDASALLAEPGAQLVSEGSDEGAIELKVVNAAQKESDAAEGMFHVHLTIARQGDRNIIVNRRASAPETVFFVCGYGAGRGNVGPTHGRDYRVMDSVATLFDYQHMLVDSELMLRRLEDFLGTSRYEQAMMGIKRVLGLGVDHRISFAKGGGLRISGPGIGKDIPLDSWADGYRMTFSWMLDLYGWAMGANALTEDGGVRGILLIDEIEQHLHPSMQAELLDEVAKALPEMQIFATTHSPMVALGTRSENIIALHRKEKEVCVAPVPSLVGYTAEDVLVEEALFGTDPYPRDTREKLNRYRDLSSIPAGKRKEHQVDEMGVLATELAPAKLPHLRDDPIARKLDEIAELLSQGDET